MTSCLACSLCPLVSTTHSHLTGDFPENCKRPAFCGAARGRVVSGSPLQQPVQFPAPGFSGPESFFLGNRDAVWGDRFERRAAFKGSGRASGVAATTRRASQRWVAPIPRGSRPSRAALTRAGERKASEIVMVTLRGLPLLRVPRRRSWKRAAHQSLRLVDVPFRSSVLEILATLRAAAFGAAQCRLNDDACDKQHVAYQWPRPVDTRADARFNFGIK